MTLVDGFDLCMLLIVVFFAVKGIFRGFSGEIFSLAGVIGGVYFGFKYADPVDAALRNFFGSLNASVSRMIAIALVFFAVCIVCALIGKLFRALLSMVSLLALDRLCGFLVGGVKGAAIVILVVVALQHAERFLPGVELKDSRTVLLVNTILPDIKNSLDAFFPKQIV